MNDGPVSIKKSFTDGEWVGKLPLCLIDKTTSRQIQLIFDQMGE
jgi:hypothetical protein